MKRLLTFISVALTCAGLLILAWDMVTFRRYGFHVNEVAGFTEYGEPIDWPTGEIPLPMQFPIWVHATVLWIFGFASFLLRRTIGRAYRGRIVRGTE